MSVSPPSAAAGLVFSVIVADVPTFLASDVLSWLLIVELFVWNFNILGYHIHWV